MKGRKRKMNKIATELTVESVCVYIFMYIYIHICTYIFADWWEFCAGDPVDYMGAVEKNQINEDRKKERKEEII